MIFLFVSFQNFSYLNVGCPKLIPYCFSFSLFFPFLLFCFLSGGTPHLYFLFRFPSFVISCFSFPGTLFYFLNLPVIPPVLVSWIQYLCLYLIIATLTFFVHFLPLHISTTSHSLICPGLCLLCESLPQMSGKHCLSAQASKEQIKSK